MKQVKGTELYPEQQAAVLRSFIHRYTGTHKPQWAEGCPVQFKDDNDWLNNTRFWITKSGELSRLHRFCESTPTWPNNPELRRANG